MRHASRMIGGVLVAIIALVSPLNSTQAADETILSSFEGEWTSTDDAFGQSAKSTMTWSKALGGKFTQINYEIQMTSDAGQTSSFTGLGYYRHQEGGSFKAFWADNTGDLHPILAKEDGNALVSIWGVEGSKLGRTRYELNDDGTLTVTDWIKSNNEWKQFNSNTFTRVSEDR